MKTTLDKVKVGEIFIFNGFKIKATCINGNILYYSFVSEERTSTLYRSGKNKVEIISVKNNKLNRKLYPNYKEIDGYLVDEK